MHGPCLTGVRNKGVDTRAGDGMLLWARMHGGFGGRITEAGHSNEGAYPILSLHNCKDVVGTVRITVSSHSAW